MILSETFLAGVFDEMKQKPFTMLMLGGMWLVIYLLWNAQGNFARAGDLTHLRTEVIEVKYSVDKASLQSQLRQIDSEYFRLERLTKDMETNRKPIDDIYLQRLSELKTDKEALQLELNSVQKHITQITSPPKSE